MTPLPVDFSLKHRSQRTLFSPSHFSPHPPLRSHPTLPLSPRLFPFLSLPLCPLLPCSSSRSLLPSPLLPYFSLFAPPSSPFLLNPPLPSHTPSIHTLHTRTRADSTSFLRSRCNAPKLRSSGVRDGVHAWLTTRLVMPCVLPVAGMTTATAVTDFQKGDSKARFWREGGRRLRK